MTTHVFQSPVIASQRMHAQLLVRRVDAGQYYGGGETAQAWAAVSAMHPMKHLPPVPLDRDGRWLVVDLGPGSGRPCVAAIQPFTARVEKVVCVDTSAAMAALAADHIRSVTAIDVDCIFADFLQDRARLGQVLGDYRHPKLVLCLGGTAGNYSQRRMFEVLRSYLGEDDRLLLGLGVYDPQDPEKELRALGEFFVSKVNCRFGLNCLRACGGKPDHRHTFAVHEDDPDEEGVKVVRGFYRFPEDITLNVAGQTVEFYRGEQLQFVESRRYPRDGVAAFLKRHGLAVIASANALRHGVYLSKLDGPSRRDT